MLIACFSSAILAEAFFVGAYVRSRDAQLRPKLKEITVVHAAMVLWFAMAYVLFSIQWTREEVILIVGPDWESEVPQVIRFAPAILLPISASFLAQFACLRTGHRART